MQNPSPRDTLGTGDQYPDNMSAYPEAKNGSRGGKSGANLEQSKAIGQDSPAQGSRQGREYLREQVTGQPPSAAPAAEGKGSAKP